MKYLFLFLIIFYQKILSSMLKNILGVDSFCRYYPTCSQYAKTSIIKYGILKGGYMSFTRLLGCQPFKPAIKPL